MKGGDAYDGGTRPHELKGLMTLPRMAYQVYVDSIPQVTAKRAAKAARLIQAEKA